MGNGLFNPVTALIGGDLFTVYKDMINYAMFPSNLDINPWQRNSTTAVVHLSLMPDLTKFL